jgi:hypothetical protein
MAHTEIHWKARGIITKRSVEFTLLKFMVLQLILWTFFRIGLLVCYVVIKEDLMKFLLFTKNKIGVE